MIERPEYTLTQPPSCPRKWDHLTGDTALRFGHWFGSDPQFWLNLQTQYDLIQAGQETGAEVRHLPTRADIPGKGTNGSGSSGGGWRKPTDSADGTIPAGLPLGYPKWSRH